MFGYCQTPADPARGLYDLMHATDEPSLQTGPPGRHQGRHEFVTGAIDVSASRSSQQSCQAADSCTPLKARCEALRRLVYGTRQNSQTLNWPHRVGLSTGYRSEYHNDQVQQRICIPQIEEEHRCQKSPHLVDAVISNHRPRTLSADSQNAASEVTAQEVKLVIGSERGG